MPRLVQDDDTMQTGAVEGMQAFKFSGTRIENLGATEYTLVTIAVDVTGSVHHFKDELRKALIAAVKSCKRSPRSDNLLVRVILFSTQYDNGIEELHGFKPLSEINPEDYPQLQPGGMTPLCDAAFSSVGAVNTYAKQLMDDDFLTNGIVFLITDGYDNASSTSLRMVAEEIEKGVRNEEIESLLTILIGINATDYQDELNVFQGEAGIDQYIDAGDATEGNLAKLADFVSQSISSQSQALGTGGPSQNIAAKI